jgi:hypothetical protein
VNSEVAYEHILEAAELNVTISRLLVATTDLYATLQDQVADVLAGRSNPDALQHVRDVLSGLTAELENEGSDLEYENHKDDPLRSGTLQADTSPESAEASTSNSDTSSPSDSSDGSDQEGRLRIPVLLEHLLKQTKNGRSNAEAVGNQLHGQKRKRSAAKTDSKASSSDNDTSESSPGTSSGKDTRDPVAISIRSDSSDSSSDSSDNEASKPEHGAESQGHGESAQKIIDLGEASPQRPKIQPPKPQDHIRVALLRERVLDFLPKMERSKAEMEKKRKSGTLKSLNAEDVDDADKVIEMDLGLGVLEEKEPPSKAMDGIVLKESEPAMPIGVKWDNWESISSRLWPAKRSKKGSGIAEV